MKKKFLVFGAFTASCFFGFGQNPASIYAKKKIAKSDIQLIYSHYIQNGNHSAVTGGIGTEKLQVYGPEIIFKREVDSLNSYSIDAGVDVVSSASTDNIDFILSSASKVDLHSYFSLGYDRHLKKNKNIIIGGSGYASLESDYLSLGAILTANIKSRDQSREFSAVFESYFDDLRWGRLKRDEPLGLVYPVELRYKEWFNHYRRNTINLNLSFQQTINNKNLLAFFPGFTYQSGLLSTPFQRVYFKNNEERVENLPDKRIEIPLGIQLNSFVGQKTILRNYYRFYWDDFGIIAHTFNIEFAIKLSTGFTLTPMLRIYTQKGSSFFKPYHEHDSLQTFYTSDYDLSSFQSFEPGLETRFASIGKSSEPRYVSLRYNFYKRSDGLHAHILTLSAEFISEKKRNHRLVTDLTRKQ
jgi:hypothetical protein